MKTDLVYEQLLESSFETQDIQLASCLFALGASLTAIDRTNPNRCKFVFEDSIDLQKTVEAYWQRLLSIEPQTLLAALKAIKSRLYDNQHG